MQNYTSIDRRFCGKLLSVSHLRHTFFVCKDDFSKRWVSQRWKRPLAGLSWAYPKETRDLKRWLLMALKRDVINAFVTRVPNIFRTVMDFVFLLQQSGHLRSLVKSGGAIYQSTYATTEPFDLIVVGVVRLFCSRLLNFFERFEQIRIPVQVHYL